MRVRYFFNLILGRERLSDPEGAEFASFVEAHAEAEQVVRDMAAEELRGGRSIAADWRLEIADGFGNVHSTVMFEAVIRTPVQSQRRLLAVQGEARGQVAKEHDGGSSLGLLEHHYRCKHLLEESRKLASSIKATFQEMREHLSTLK